MSTCEKCNTACCSRFNIFLTASDIKRIQRSLKLDPIDFTSPFPASDFPSPSVYPKFKIEDEWAYLALDKKLGKQECVFLLTPGNSKRCGINAFKPMVCRTYPFTLDSAENLETVDPFICPKYWWPEKKERVRAVNDITVQRKELEEYRKLVECWNENNSHHEYFLGFLTYLISSKSRPSV